MALSPKTWIPSVNFGVKVAIAMACIFLILKYVPLPQGVKNLFMP